MSPRAYKAGERKAAAGQTRGRIVEAAREILVDEGGMSGFTMEAVARRAGVNRMTVYYQFGSKVELLEAIFDSLAVGDLVERLEEALSKADPLEGLSEYIAAFGSFWDTDRFILRRLRGLAALDSDFEQVSQGREQRRRDGIDLIVRSLSEGYDLTGFGSLEEAVDVLYALSSFETFDTLAGASSSPKEVVPLVNRLSRAALGLKSA